ncbi:MAG: sulfotransferase [Xanthomonadales bacterium]|nr:sulfotransferase [Xanthomonadales bacterium]
MMTPAWQTLLHQGIKAVQQRQASQALELLQQAQKLKPDSREVNYWLGNAQRLCGLAAEAEQTFRKLLAANTADFDSTLALAFLLREQARLSDFNQVLLAFVAQPSADSPSLLKITGLLRDSNQFSSAIAVMQQLVAREPGLASHHFKLARLYQGVGEHEAALKAFRSSLLLDTTIGGAWLGLATLQKFSDADNADWQLICTAPEQAADSEAALCIAFARGKGFDDLENYAQAWKHYLEGNHQRSLNQSWNPAAWKDFVTQQLSQPIERYEKCEGQRNAVFIVGMLRSGTTLLEQLLDHHSRITGRGELNFLAHAWKSWEPVQRSRSANNKMTKTELANNKMVANELATQIWKHMRLDDGPADHYYIDKNPLNFRYLSMLSEIMPEAKILHLRRDGRDSCLSCFMQLFQHPDAAFSNQLDALVDYYRGYLQLMQHFSQRLPDQIMTLAYEDLIEDKSATVGTVLDFLGLPGSASDISGTSNMKAAGSTADSPRPIRTASAWQARQNVHRNSLGRWQNYYEFAPTFFDRIAELDAEFSLDSKPD